MKTSISTLTLILTFIILHIFFGQDGKNKGVFEEEKDGFYKNEILKSIDEFNTTGKRKEEIIQA
ncbi:MAG: hypothetical protein U5J96_14610, partial [Ignavibacteriaceae bacterium]|nr:hypothetical protein [Ignavibacteriaceae bacterium]